MVSRFERIKRSRYNVFDMFSGIGGFRHAINASSRANTVNFIGDCENDKYAVDTYWRNFGNFDEIHISDIRDYLNTNSVTLPRIDLLTAGFPCQAFSSAGHEGGFEDERGNLFFSLAAFIDRHKPRTILLENVKRLVTTNSGETLRTILDTLTGMRYYLKWQVLDSSRFGVPQKRERWVCVGFKSYNESEQFNFPSGEEGITLIRDILEDTIHPSHYISERALAPLAHINELPLKPGRCIQKIVPYHRQKSVYSIDGLSPTVREGHGDFVRIKQDDGRIRRLTPREGLRLMGFPDTHGMNSSVTRQYKLIGNSIVVPQMTAVINEIMRVTNG